MYRKLKVDWSAVDWSKTNVEISKEVGVSHGSVAYRRRGIPERRLARPSRRVDWSSADWNQNNSSIAIQLNCTDRAVAYARLRHAPDRLRNSPMNCKRVLRLDAGEVMVRGKVIKVGGAR